MALFTSLSTFPLTPSPPPLHRQLHRFRPFKACLSSPSSSSSTPEFPKPSEAIRSSSSSSSAAHIHSPVTEGSKEDGNGNNYVLSSPNGSHLHPLSLSAESNIERIIFDYRFFTFLAIGVSLAGSLMYLSSPSSSSFTPKFSKPREAIQSSSSSAFSSSHIHNPVTNDSNKDKNDYNYALSNPTWSHISPLSLSAESKIERMIFDFRFFALFAIGGSLAGSLLCFLNGCVFIYEAYKVYWTSCVKGIHSGQMVLKLVEAIDVYLAGTVMLIFGMGLYGLFISNVPADVHPSVDRALKGSSLFGMFALKERPRWMKISSLDELKTKVGHVIVMILLVKMFERSKTVVIATGMDLLRYSVCIFLSSASLYILHNLHKSD